jgi:lipoate-protein ligase A
MARARIRLLDEATSPSEAADNMAVDEVLLRGAAERPTLRLYAWRRAAVSLGFFQRIADAGPLASEGFPLVRRLTGGGAILHRDEVTYAIAAPRELLFPGGIEASYARVHRAIGRALSALGVPVDALEEAPALAMAGRAERVRARRAAPESFPFLCYERRSRCDLRSGGKKLVGSAQRREGARVLQHGSIPLGVEANAPGATTARIASGRPIDAALAGRAIADEIARALEVDLFPEALSEEEVALARDLVRDRYASPDWTASR